MLVVALVCIAAGTWQIARFDQKVRENDALRRNAALPVAPVSQVLTKVGAPAPSLDSVEFRPVRATGRYETSHQTLVRNRTVGGVTGFLVLTPLRTAVSITDSPTFASSTVLSPLGLVKVILGMEVLPWGVR